MNEAMIRFWQPADVPELREIFTVSFGDPPEIVESFHRAFLNAPEACILAAVPDRDRPEGRPVAAAYCIPGPALRFSDCRVSSVYLYAFACRPAWRGRGIMKQVYSALFEEARRQAPAMCLIPASEGLLQAYSRTGCVFSPLGRMRSARLSGAGKAGFLPAERLSWQEYARRREAWLEPYPHAVYPDSWYLLMEAYGYVFLACPGALAAAVPLEDRVLIPELLCSSADPAGALAGIAAACPAEQYEVRTPAFFSGPGELRPYAYIHESPDHPPVPENFWYPFGLE